MSDSAPDEERREALVAEAEALGIKVDGRWSDATLEAKIAEQQAPAEEVVEMSDETKTAAVEGADMSVADEQALKVALAGKLSAMQPGVIVHPEWDIPTLQEKIEKIQKEQLAKELEALGVPVDPSWSIERFQEEIAVARVPIDAPEGINVVQVGLKEGEGIKVQCITDKVHLGDGQTMRKMEKALVTDEVADILEKNEQCVRLGG